LKRQHSIPLSLVESLLSGPLARGVSLKHVFDEAGLSHWQALLDNPEEGARFPLDELGTFLITLWRHMSDESGGFLHAPLKLGTFSMMCHAIISAGNLRRALLRSARYISLVNDDLVIQLEEQGDEARIVFEWSNSLDNNEVFFTTSLFVIWVRLSCWLIDRPILLDRVEFQFEEPCYASEFSLMFPCRRAFSQKRNVVALSKRVLSAPIKQDPQSLVGFLSHAPQSLLTQYRADDSVTAQIKRMLQENDSIETAPSVSFDDVAVALNSTTHTLRRRLKDEGQTYQDIKDSVRREKAFELLESSSQSIHEISDQLGFSEPAAFNRAFKKWTGLTPNAHREQTK